MREKAKIEYIHKYTQLEAAEEDAVIDGMFLIGDAMQDANVSKAELARILGKSRSWVGKLLSGDQNLTLRTLAGTLHQLGYALELKAVPLEKKSTPESASEASVETPLK